MATWREQLAQAEDWKGYRTALRTLREGGPVFDELPARSEEIAKKVPGLRGYSKSAFAQLLPPNVPDIRPEWPKVELVVRICAEHQGAENVTAVVRQWADAYRVCGGDPGERFPPTPQQKETPAAPAPEPAPEPARAPVPDPVPTPAPSPNGRPERAWWRSKPAVAAALLLAAAALVLGSIQINFYLNQYNDGAQPPVEQTGPSQPTGTKAIGPTSGQPGTTKHTSTPSPSPSAKTSAPKTEEPANIGRGRGGGQNGGSGLFHPVEPVDQPTGTVHSAHVAWSDDGGGGGSTADTVNVYSSYRKDDDFAQRLGTLNRTDAIKVVCQAAGGRGVGVGPAYPGPASAKERDAQGIWYRTTEPLNGWIPGVYVDTGMDSLPAC
ncbi:hypothetical protein ACIRBY_37745 [Streptomyces sp. NPDC096136]|uniref:hypothetical protein n=1 Tax=Streptomyces sp. NPDC096136 TaxID=3366076 RepID=UPI00380273AC